MHERQHGVVSLPMYSKKQTRLFAVRDTFIVVLDRARLVARLQQNRRLSTPIWSPLLHGCLRQVHRAFHFPRPRSARLQHGTPQFIKLHPTRERVVVSSKIFSSLDL